MTTLTTEPLASLIERLYAQAGAATSPVLHTVPGEERERLMHSKTEYLKLYEMVRHLIRLVHPAPGGSTARQRWRCADRQRIRTVED
jgi:hypothetical protein